MTRHHLVALLVTILAAPGCPPVMAQEQRVEIFRLEYSSAVEMEKIAAAMLSPEGWISVNESSNSLVVVDTPEAIGRVKSVLERLDVKPANIRIEVTFVEKSRIEKLNLKIRWRLAGNGWMVGSIIPPPGGSPLAVEAFASLETSESMQKQTILVLENTPGRIFVGGEYPTQERTVHGDRGYAYMTETTRFKSAGTSLYVIASRAGKGKLKVSVEPESGHMDKETGTYNVKRASTTVVINDPGTLALSRTGGGSEGASVNIPAAAQASSTSGSFMMILSAHSEE